MSGSLSSSLATILRSKVNKMVAQESPAIIPGNSVSQVSRNVPDPEAVMPEVMPEAAYSRRCPRGISQYNDGRRWRCN